MFISSLDSETPFVLWEAEGTKEGVGWRLRMHRVGFCSHAFRGN